MTCGGGIGNADIYNRKLSEKKRLNHMGSAQIIMPDNYIALFDTPTTEKAEKIVREAEPDCQGCPDDQTWRVFSEKKIRFR